MKVLFAVNNEKISESIIKKYQENYKEIISGKNVYYFNAIIKELQKDKSYDRIVISEDLEPFANNNYEAIDKFIFDKLDSISDEASNSVEGDIPIILICTDRRTKAESLLVKLFGIGIYSALLGQDRSIDNVCNLVYKPRTKKEAKVYYKIDAEDVDYKPENEEDVSESEIQNILAHYKKLGKNEDKYIESFDSIASQYNDSQLKLIARFLPLNIKVVLESRSPKYQQVMMGTKSIGTQAKGAPELNNIMVDQYSKKAMKDREQDKQLDMIQRELDRSKLTKPVVIPSGMDTTAVKKVYTQQPTTTLPPYDEIERTKPVQYQQQPSAPMATPTRQQNMETNVQPQMAEDSAKVDELLNLFDLEDEPEEPKEEVKRGRGRPKKLVDESQIAEETPKKKRGRPRKIDPVVETQQEPEELVDLFNLGGEPEEPKEDIQMGAMLPGLDETDDVMEQPTLGQTMPSYEEETPYKQEETYTNPIVSRYEDSYQPDNRSYEPQFQNQTYAREMETTNQYQSQGDITSLLTSDKKIVSFVGTSKNGTSFLINNLAELFSQKGINTAILDLTQNRNAYYIYTQNEENLRNVAFSCMENLRRGIPEGIIVNKNLTVYTSLPGENDEIRDYSNILETLVKNYSLILLDCDFETDYAYFAQSQEVYLVQSLDVLTIQPLTAFLRDLKSKNVLDQNKLRVVINKNMKVRSMTEKTIIGGMAFYNDPAMSFMTELFNKDTVAYETIPFEDQTYSKYLEGLVNCQISLNGYSKIFMEALNRLGNMVYPLIHSSQNNGQPKNYNDYQKKNKKKNKKMNDMNSSTGFSNDMNNTLDRMKRGF